MNIKELTRHYGVERCTIYDWMKAGCPHKRIDVSPLRNVAQFELAEVDAWLAARNAARAAKGGKGAAPAKVEKVPAPAPAAASAGRPAGVEAVIQYLVTRAEIALVGAALHDCASDFITEMEGCGWCGSDGHPVVDWKPLARAFALRWQKGGVA